MRFMMMVNATANSEDGVLPGQELIEAMGKFNQELIDAGVLVDAAGLQASSKGARVFFSGDSRSVTDGPFVETKELISGYWIIQAKSKEEAVAWAKRSPNPYGPDGEGHIEVRQMFEMEDFK